MKRIPTWMEKKSSYARKKEKKKILFRNKFGGRIAKKKRSDTAVKNAMAGMPRIG